jgi:hypothetical protein
MSSRRYPDDDGPPARDLICADHAIQRSSSEEKSHACEVPRKYSGSRRTGVSPPYPATANPHFLVLLSSDHRADNIDFRNLNALGARRDRCANLKIKCAIGPLRTGGKVLES